jgi:hypothetical protein
MSTSTAPTTRYILVIYLAYTWYMPIKCHILGKHLEPWHPDIECRTFDIEQNIRYRRLRFRMLVRYRRFLHWISYIDIEGVRYRMSLYSKLKNRRYRRSRTGLSISKFRLFDIEHNDSISCSDIVYDIEGLFHVRYRFLSNINRSISNNRSISCTT